jgi:hypothetical protein
MALDEFSYLVSPQAWGGGGENNPGRIALRNTADIAWACHVWLCERGLKPSAADVIAFTRLVLEQEAILRSASEQEAHTPTAEEPWS